MRKSSLCILFVLAFLALCLVGCVAPQSTASDSGTSGSATTDSFRFQEDAWSANTGRILSHTELDPDGFNRQISSPTHDMAVLLPAIRADGSVYLDGNGNPVFVKLFSSDPSNSNLKGFKAGFTEFGFTVEIAELSHDLSSVIQAHDLQVIERLKTDGIITQAQADVAKTAILAGKDIVSALAEIGIRFAFPTP